MRKLLVASICAVGLVGCVSSTQYQEKETEVEGYKRRLADEEGRATALDAKVKDLEARVTASADDVRKKQVALEAENKALKDKIAALEQAATAKDNEKKELEAKVAELTAELEKKAPKKK